MHHFLNYARSTSLYRELCELFDAKDGNLLDQTNDEIASSQIEFIRWAIHLAAPRLILETGTNKGFFSYLLSLICRDVVIYTFDTDPRSARAVELINSRQNNIRAIFTVGDTRQTLQTFNVPAQFAWIDGGHSEDIPINDLTNCLRLRIQHVAIDDTVLPDVSAAVQQMVAKTPYRLLHNPFAQHDRRRAVLMQLAPG